MTPLRKGLVLPAMVTISMFAAQFAASAMGWIAKQPVSRVLPLNGPQWRELLASRHDAF